jgi:hypothetical protein
MSTTSTGLEPLSARSTVQDQVGCRNLQVGQNRFKCRQVSVDVGDNRRPHKNPRLIIAKPHGLRKRYKRTTRAKSLMFTDPMRGPH